MIVLFYMDSLNRTSSLFYIKVHEAKKALIKNIGLVNRVHLTVLYVFTPEVFTMRKGETSF